MMALADVLTRLVVIDQRGRRLAAGSAAPAAAVLVGARADPRTRPPRPAVSMTAQLAAAPCWQGVGHRGVSGRGSPSETPFGRGMPRRRACGNAVSYR